MAKDRARPFSRKHRRYWIPVTGGMLLICGLNVAVGMCAYEQAPDHVQRIEPVLPASPAPAIAPRPPGMIGLGDLPVPVVRAFAKAFPQHVPMAAKKLDDGRDVPTFELTFTDGGTTRTATFRADGTRP